MSTAAMVVKPSLIGELGRSAFVALGVALFATGADNYGYVFLGTPPPLQLIALFVAGAVALAVYDARMPLPLLKSPFLVWVMFYFLLTTLWAVWMRSTPLVTQALETRYRSIACMAAFSLLFTTPRARRVAVLALAAMVVCVSVMYLAELARVVEFQKAEEYSRVEGRSAGFYGNANVAAMSIVFALAAIVGRLREAWRLPLLAIGAVGVLTTFSRGGQVCFGALVLVLAWRGRIRLAVPVVVAICGGIIALLTVDTGALLRFLQSHDLVNASTLARLQFEAGDSGRAELARKALDVFLDAPWLGAGLGSTIDWGDINSSHNQFLNLAGDHGILGLLTFPALGLALVWRNSGAIPFAVVLMLAGFVSHNLLQDRGYLLVMALAASYAFAPDGADAEPGEATEPNVHDHPHERL